MDDNCTLNCKVKLNPSYKILFFFERKKIGVKLKVKLV